MDSVCCYHYIEKDISFLGRSRNSAPRHLQRCYIRLAWNNEPAGDKLITSTPTPFLIQVFEKLALSMWNLDGSVDYSRQDPLPGKVSIGSSALINIQGGGYPENPKLQNQPNSAQTAGSQRRLVSD